jgi:hypothetical protein
MARFAGWTLDPAADGGGGSGQGDCCIEDLLLLKARCSLA